MAAHVDRDRSRGVVVSREGTMFVVEASAADGVGPTRRRVTDGPGVKGFRMLISQLAQCEVAAAQGSHAAVLAELQATPEAPRVPTGAHRRRLLDLAERLARVQSLGGEYARVCFSPAVESRLRSLTAGD